MPYDESDTAGECHFESLLHHDEHYRGKQLGGNDEVTPKRQIVCGETRSVFVGHHHHRQQKEIQKILKISRKSKETILVHLSSNNQGYFSLFQRERETSNDMTVEFTEIFINQNGQWTSQ